MMIFMFRNSKKFLIFVLIIIMSAVQTANATQHLQGYRKKEFSSAPFVSNIKNAHVFHLAIGLPLRNTSQLQKLLADIYDSKSPNYRHFLTPADFSNEFAPQTSDYNRMVTYLKSRGFQVATSSGPMLVDADGTNATIERAFHVRLHYYKRKDGSKFFAPDGEPTLDIDVPIGYIAGLDNFRRAAPEMTSAPVSNTSKKRFFGRGSVNNNVITGSGPGSLLAGKDFRNAYVPCTSLTGNGQTIALLELSTYYPADVTAYENYQQSSGLPVPTVQALYLGPTSANTVPQGGYAEVALDVDMAMAMAPQSTILIYMDAFSASNSANAAVDDIQAAIAAQGTAYQISSSWSGWLPDSNEIASEMEMAAQGQSYFQASGDYGAYTYYQYFRNFFGGPANPDPIDNRDDTYITLVGGTELLLNSGTPTSWASEQVWNSKVTEQYTTSNGITDAWTAEDASGGGTFSYGLSGTGEAIPTYQSNANINWSANGGSTIYRNAPDVAMAAENIFQWDSYHGVTDSVGGTSAAAPLWAAFTALANQQSAISGKPPLGFANPYLYGLASNAGSYALNFHDISSNNTDTVNNPRGYPGNEAYQPYFGYNGVLYNVNITTIPYFSPMSGFDLTTGWGSPQCALINSEVALIPTITYTDTPTSTVTPTYSITPTFTNTSTPMATPFPTLTPQACCPNGSEWVPAVVAPEFSVRSEAATSVFQGKIWELGGSDNSSIGFSEAWSSPDGTHWTEQTKGTAAFGKRYSAGALSYNGLLWVLGGYIGVSATSTVYNSADGQTWNLVGTGNFAAGNLFNDVAVFNGAMWVLDSSGAVWTSTTGLNWTQAHTGLAGGVMTSGMGSLWVITGNSTTGNAIWQSTNGATWTRIGTMPSGFKARQYFGLTTSCNQLYLTGGKGCCTVGDGPAPFYNDVWSSANGVTWGEATPNAGYQYVEGFGWVSFNNTLWMIGGNGPGGVYNAVWNDICVVASPTQTSSVSPTYTQTSSYTATPTSTPSGTVTNTLTSSPTNSLTPTATPNSAACCESGATWQTKTSAAAFGPRFWFESTVFQNQMWIFGGYNGKVPFSDIWNTADGIHWLSVNPAAPLGYRTNGAALTFDPGDGNGPRMWVISGLQYENPTPPHDVWSSFDGKAWTEVNSNPGFVGGLCRGLVFNGEMWIFADDGSVWSSANGVIWTKSTSNGGWGTPWTYSNPLVFNGAMWVVSSSGTTDQVWTSTGGAWTQVSVTAPFTPRTHFLATAICGKMWVATGLGSAYDNDVWTSTNGSVWSQATSGGGYGARDDASDLIFNNTVWLIAGRNAAGAVSEVDSAVCDITASASVATSAFRRALVLAPKMTLTSVSAGLHELNWLHGVVVVPNPAQSRTTVFANLGNPGELTIEIYNLNGSVVYSHNFGYQMSGIVSREINLGGWASGVYLAMVKTHAEGQTRLVGVFKWAIVK